MDNSAIQTLDQLIQYGKTSDFSITMSVFLLKVDNNILVDKMIYDRYADILKANAENIALTVEQWRLYMHKPELLSIDLYGTPNLSHLILYLNGVSIYKFKDIRLTLLSPSQITALLIPIMTRETTRIKRNKISVMS